MVTEMNCVFSIEISHAFGTVVQGGFSTDETGVFCQSMRSKQVAGNKYKHTLVTHKRGGVQLNPRNDSLVNLELLPIPWNLNQQL